MNPKTLFLFGVSGVSGLVGLGVEEHQCRGESVGLFRTVGLGFMA